MFAGGSLPACARPNKKTPMKRAILTSFCLIALCLSTVAVAQVTLNPIPARVLGHPRLTLSTGNPNLVEGKELFGPQGIAIDRAASPPILYVADTSNNRVLAWRNAKQFANGAPADLVIGQKDLYSTFSLGPGTALVGGLRLPTGLAVDAAGNLFVADSGNNRILRFPKPFSQTDPVKSPDLALGQPSLTTNGSNTGGRSAKSLMLNVVLGNRLVASALVFDAQGNLFACDPGNSRVLRYPAPAVAPDATASGPSADLVLGQVAFTVDPQAPANPSDLKFLAAPTGIALDAAGRLYVVDAYLRVVVFTSQPTTGLTAQRLIGGIYDNQERPLEPPNERSLNGPEGVFVAGNVPFVIDSANNRILRFDPFDLWPSDTKVAPSAKAVIGQDNVFGYKPNRGSALAQANSLSRPVAAVSFDGELFVADTFNHRVLVGPDPVTASGWAATRVAGQPFLDSDGVNRVEGREFYFGVPGFIGGAGVAVDRKSDPPHLYVADTLNNRVLCFRDLRKARPGDKADIVLGQPNFERTVWNYPSGSADQPQANNLLRPTGVAVDADGNLFVADTGNGRVLRFPPPFQAGTNMPAANLVLGKPNFTTPGVAVPDPSQANMGGPYGLAVTVGGHLLVSDVSFHRVLLFRKQAGGDFSDGQPASAVFGQTDFNSRISGGLEAQMNSPRHIATDTNDRLYVCDTNNSRILFFDSATAKPATNNTPDFMLSDFYNPQGIFVGTPMGEIWVADSNNRRLVRYPRFEVLIFNPQPEATVFSGSPDEAPIAVTLDSFGNMITAYSTNRVAFYFSAMTYVNAANYLPRIAPGMIVSLFPLPGVTFGDQTKVFSSVPLPTELTDIQVLVDDVPAPLYFVSPNQVNFLMPMNAPSSGTVEIQVVRKSNGQVLGVGCSIDRNANASVRRSVCVAPVQMTTASPAFYAGQAGINYGLGAGAVAALNRKGTDGSYYGINTPANPVARGDIVEMYGTGQGFIPNAPPDGSPATGAVSTPDVPRVIVGTGDSEILYSGLAPGNVGLWQINVKIPNLVAPDPAVPVAILHKGIPSTNPQCSPTADPPCPTARTTISVKQ
jgi:uncharacterized protein (TIGR03437 family)